MFTKLKTFWHVYSKSISEPAYYNDILTAPFSFSLKYFGLFFLILTILNTIQFTLIIKPSLSRFFHDTVHDITTNYPHDLVLAFTQGQLTVTGVDQPFHVPFPSDTQDLFNDSDTYDHFITIDSNLDTAAPKTLITLGKEAFVIRQQTGSKETIPYTNLIENNLTIDKNTIDQSTSTNIAFVNQLIAYSPLIFFSLMLIFAPLTTILLLLIYSFFTYTVTTILGKHLGYKKSFQIGLHTITFAETASFLQSLFFTNIDLPSMYSLAFFGATFLAIYAIRRQQQT